MKDDLEEDETSNLDIVTDIGELDYLNIIGKNWRK